VRLRSSLLAALLVFLPALLSAQTYGVSVTPQGSTTANRTTHTTGYTQSFRVQNEGSASQTFTFTCGGASGVACTSVSQSSATLAGNTFINVTATYSTANEGTGQLYFRATGPQSTDQGYVWVPILLPAGAPRMTVLYLDAKQDLGRCAMSCFAATYAQSTVPYYSLDAPRNVSLVYHQDRVVPKPFVAVDVFPDTTYGSWPTEYQFQVKVNSALVTFLNGEQTLRFRFDSTNLNSTKYRLAGQFDASSYTHGTVYSMEVLVSAKIGGSLFTNRWLTNYLHVDEGRSTNPIGRGWTLAGIQRLYGQADGSKLITEGDGSATYFKYDTASATFTTPTADFSALKTSGSNWIRSFPDSTKLTFNSSGYLTAITDRWGKATTVTYDGSNRISQVKDTLSNAITLAYGTNGLSTITDPMSRATTITVQSNKTLTAIQDPDGVSTSLGYDGSLRLQTITNRRGKATTLAYDSNSGKVSTITAPSIPVYGGGSSSPVTTLSAWQSKGVPYSATSGTAASFVKADTVYARVTEPGGAVSKFTVNRWGTPAIATNAAGKQTTVTYTVAGQPAKIVGPGYGSEVDTLAYNGSGLVAYSKNAGSTGTTIVYGGWAQPTYVYGPGQDSTRYFLGSNGRIDSLRIGSAIANQRYTYDTYGRIVEVKDVSGTAITTNGYPSTGTVRNRSSVTLPGSRITSYGYDSYGRQTTVTPPSPGLVQTTYYSSVNRVDSVRVATSTPTVTKYVYDSLYLKKVTDPKGQNYQYIYNDLGWVIKQLDPAGNKDTLQYSVDGDLRRRTNRRSQNIDFGYDAIHRLTSQTGTNSLTWSYPSDTSLVAVSPAATDTFWTSLANHAAKTKTVLNAQAYSLTHLFTSYGLLDSVAVSGPAGTSFTARKYVYDALKGILTDLKLNGSTTSITSDGNFNPTAISLPGGGSVSLTQGSLGEPVKETTESTNNNYLERWIGINILGQIDRHMRWTARTGRWFEYDSLGQLRKGRNMLRNPEAQLPTGCPTNDYGMGGSCTPNPDYVEQSSTTYTYDAVGNRTDNSGAYNTGNRITTFGSCTYTTDADGNVTARSGGSCPNPATFFWSAEGQLDSVQVGATGIKYRYDASGRVVQKRVNGSSTSYFLWDGDNLLAELNGSASAVKAEYSYYGPDNLQALIVGTTKYYARSDGLGNVLALSDTAKAIKSTYEYDDWGHLTVGGDSAAFNGVDRARWKGALWMGSELELYYMRNRWYEPATGRFLSEDPIGLGGGLNPTVYAGNDPVNRSDPSGKDCIVGGYLYGGVLYVTVIFWCDKNGNQPLGGYTIPGDLARRPAGGGGGGPGRVGTPVVARDVTQQRRLSPDDKHSCLVESAALAGAAIADAVTLYGLATGIGEAIGGAEMALKGTIVSLGAAVNGGVRAAAVLDGLVLFSKIGFAATQRAATAAVNVGTLRMTIPLKIAADASYSVNNNMTGSNYTSLIPNPFYSGRAYSAWGACRDH
jgi:RHS repeat-associated protein